MGDEMDPCECLWNHELAMRQLLSLLRQGQSYCTDIQCLEASPSTPQAETAGTSFLFMFLVMAMALAMYALRPRRQQIEEDAPKAARHPQDRDGSPPTPPRI